MQAVLAGLIALTLVGPEPNADEKAGKVSCDIQVIHATRGQAFVDPALRPIARYLRNSFGRYQSFRLLGRDRMVLGRNQKRTHKLPNRTELALTYLGMESSLFRLTMEVGGLKATVKVHDGGLFFQAGRQYKSGMLIVAIRTRRAD